MTIEQPDDTSRRRFLKASGANFHLAKIENCGHFIPEEQPGIASRLLIELFR